MEKVVLRLPQHGESHRPVPLLESGSLQPVHHCADTRSVVVTTQDESCSPPPRGFSIVSVLLGVRIPLRSHTQVKFTLLDGRLCPGSSPILQGGGLAVTGSGPGGRGSSCILQCCLRTVLLVKSGSVGGHLRRPGQTLSKYRVLRYP